MKQEFEHILVPYNGTAGSQKAFKKAVVLAKLANAKLTVLTCLEERPTFGFFKTKTSKQEFERERKLIERQHLELEKLANKHDISFNAKIVKNGLASTRILEFAKQHDDIDLVIMTKTKLSHAYEKLHYQSTVENVIRNVRCPILIL